MPPARGMRPSWWRRGARTAQHSATQSHFRGAGSTRHAPVRTHNRTIRLAAARSHLHAPRVDRSQRMRRGTMRCLVRQAALAAVRAFVCLVWLCAHAFHTFRATRSAPHTHHSNNQRTSPRHIIQTRSPTRPSGRATAQATRRRRGRRGRRADGARGHGRAWVASFDVYGCVT